ncbi:hypothetical protein ACSLBF_12435 [Pseudoalteromonas sp. T1lg65]|uniref:hypothetical protein n=1 Tax=Pseudoalteromonas sp. T1lg65 TaxID=2077101 RepID=UPI003F7A8666
MMKTHFFNKTWNIAFAITTVIFCLLALFSDVHPVSEKSHHQYLQNKQLIEVKVE